MGVRTLMAGALVWMVLASAATAQDIKTGYLIPVPVPLGGNSVADVLSQLERLAESAPQDTRLDVVLRYHDQVSGGEGTQFEDALKLARAISGDQLRSIRVVSLVEGNVTGHSILPILAGDSLLMGNEGAIGDAMAGESQPDETIALTYEKLASRRSLFPTAIVKAMVDPEAELAWVTKVDGRKVFETGDPLVKLRETGEVLSEDVWSASGVAVTLNAEQLRSARISAGTVGSLEEAAEVLDLAEISEIESSNLTGEAKGVLLDVSGSVSRSRVRRWQSNLDGSLENDEINTWLVSIDSVGGDVDQSASLSSMFAMPEPPLRTVCGYVSREARADSVLIALSCKPLYLHPEAKLGGIGADQITLRDLDNHAELIELIARNTKRPAGLIRGLLFGDLEIHQYTNKNTGQVKYATAEDLVADAENAELERDRWEQGPRIELSEGLSAERAIELGLADGRSDSLDDVSRRIGLATIPNPVSDRAIVRFVERLGRSAGLKMILLMIGFVALSAEMNAPGLSFPGFLALVCFGLFFWMNYLAGTAEWLELVLLILGLGCIMLEIFVVPGFGVFGIGGLIMTIASIVLMSQTFVLPQNSYQLTVITRGLWAALGSLLGLFGGFVLMRQLFPHVPLFRHLIMEMPDAAAIDHAEKMADYSSLLNATGTTTTPLRPSGKARFGDEIVQVVSDGSMIDKGMPVRVIEVQGAKVVVEA